MYLTKYPYPEYIKSSTNKTITENREMGKRPKEVMHKRNYPNGQENEMVFKMITCQRNAKQTYNAIQLHTHENG